MAFVLSACSELEKPKPQPFYAQTEPPPVQEFRWSNGKLPKSFDPALVSAAPEADIVRAIFEGLTDTDPKTLKAVPAIATKWTASEDFKTWTFQLRRDAKWSNGKAVTAKDFVRAWKRLVVLGAKVPQRELLKNIVGMDTENVLPVFANQEIDIFSKTNGAHESLDETKQTDSNANVSVQESKTEIKIPETPKTQTKKSAQKSVRETNKKEKFGVEAIDDFVLKVSLIQADKNFPSLVAHPIFYPIYGDGKEFESGELSADIITNGAFRISSAGRDALSLERADYYWNASEINLERVKFVPTESAENALAAYRAGELDAVTNANFEPLALKLLTPFDDFRRTTHGALNFYEFNLSKPQFNDRRVREALSMAIERERLTQDETNGVTEPALSFSPFTDEEKLSQDLERAKKLLAEAGFANGQNFPIVILLINRNDMQRRIARSVARMWKKNLNIETEIIIKDQADFDAAFRNGEFDIVRRGIVLPTSDETANMLAMFDLKQQLPNKETEKNKLDASVSTDNQILNEKTAESNLVFSESENQGEEKTKGISPSNKQQTPILTEQQAIEMLPAIPLYFPMSYSLIKPYVQGFETNALDASSLKSVKINNDWQPTSQKVLSNSGN